MKRVLLALTEADTRIVRKALGCLADADVPVDMRTATHATRLLARLDVAPTITTREVGHVERFAAIAESDTPERLLGGQAAINAVRAALGKLRALFR